MYEARFGLVDSPFRIAPDLRFFVETAPHGAAIQALREGLAQGDEFMLLAGEFGAGKTMAARRLFQQVPRERDVVGLLTSQRIEGDAVFERIAEAFALETFELRHPLVAMTRALEGFGREGRKALLLIDEAHSLDVHSLRRLRKLTGVQVGGRGVLQVLLAGRHAPPGIAELRKIGRPLALGTHIVLGGLDEAGSRAYVRRRLELAGWTGRPSIDDALQEIHVRCEGNPGRINRLCSHVLLQLFMKNLPGATRGFVRAVDELMASELEGGDGADGDEDEVAPGGAERETVEDASAAGALLRSASPPQASAEAPTPTPMQEQAQEQAQAKQQAQGHSQATPAAAREVDEAQSATSPSFPDGASLIDLAIRRDEAEAAPPTPRGEGLSAPPTAQAEPAAAHARSWATQGLAAAVIFVCGGLAWQAVSARIDAASRSSREAAPPSLGAALPTTAAGAEAAGCSSGSK